MHDILKKLDQTVNTFSQYMLTLPPSSLHIQKSGLWSPHQVVSHIVFWHEQYGNIISAILRDDEPVLLSGSFIENNRYAVEVNKDETINHLILRLENAQKVLALYCKNRKAKNIYLSFKQGGKKRSLREALRRIEGHIRSHQRQLIRLGFK